ncbi:capsular polysaccharide biosynthesis protein [Bacteroidia bacterium]|nr:capsular polysaccharide biosynthesis protein [Bacteroidia bacterium]GHV44090.1 capsular polysaccharide biosynthesis protein [Bacteroidia bacterium]
MLFEKILRKIYKRFWENRLFDKNVILLIDSIIIIVSSIFGYALTLQIYRNIGSIISRPSFWKYGLVTLALNLIFFLLFKTYKGIIRYSTIREFGRVLSALTFAYICVFGALFAWIEPSGTVSLVYCCMAFLCSLSGLYGFRIISVYLFQRLTKRYGDNPAIPVLVWGLNADNIALAQLLNVGHNKYSVVGFLTTELKSKLKEISDLPVFELKSPDDLKDIDFDNLLFSNEKELKEAAAFVEKALSLERRVYIAQELNINSVSQLSHIGRNIRSVQIEDLLGRSEIQINMNSIEEQIRKKTILVTGASGSIGSEIVNQIAKFAPRFIVCLDFAETPLNDLDIELKKKYPALNFEVIVGDIRNRKKMEFIFKTFNPQIIYHCAAYKHVPMMERFPSEAATTNIYATKTLVDYAIAFNVEMFVMISTDKAVNPTNIMGATKRIAEIYVQSVACDTDKNTSNTKFITTRFGNVLGSNGSVIPLFKKQIECGGPVTVTHPEITRYFMTIPEACRLVLEASVIGESGYIYIFDMSEPLRIAHLARKMIELSGFVPEKDIKIEFTGLRPGEKLYEELLNDSEITEKTPHEKIKMAKVRKYCFTDIVPQIDKIIDLAKHNSDEELVKAMKMLVPEFISKNSKYEKFDVCRDNVHTQDFSTSPTTKLLPPM